MATIAEVFISWQMMAGSKLPERQTSTSEVPAVTWPIVIVAMVMSLGVDEAEWAGPDESCNDHRSLTTASIKGAMDAVWAAHESCNDCKALATASIKEAMDAVD